MLENLALRQQLAVFRRTRQAPNSGTEIDCSRFCSPMGGEIGARADPVPWGHSDTRRPDGRGESSLGSPSNSKELGKLGIDGSERTVSRLLRRRHHPPSQIWRRFLTNHVAALVSTSMDFFAVPTRRPGTARRRAISGRCRGSLSSFLRARDQPVAHSPHTRAQATWDTSQSAGR